MILDSQNQFRESYMQSLKKGEEVKLPQGYDVLYQEWSAKYENVLYQWSAEEMTQRFSIFVEEKMQEKVNSLLKQNEYSVEEQNRLKLLLARRQIVLASDDGGLNFNRIVKAEDIRKANDLDLVLLSPTLHETTSNLQEVLDDQAVLYVTHKLAEQQFTVQEAWVDEDHKVHVSVVSRGGITEVDVDISGEVTKPLVYQFINENTGKVKELVETQLPEEFGQAEGDIALINATDEEIDWAAAIGHGKDANRKATNAANAANAIKAAKDAQDTMNVLNAANAIDAQRNTQQAMAAPALQAQAANAQLGQISNVMASKAAMKARTERNVKKMRRDKEIYDQIAATRERDAKKWRDEQRDKEIQLKKDKKNKANKEPVWLQQQEGFLVLLAGQLPVRLYF